MERTVKCYYCNKEFYRSQEDWVKIKNRYAHSSCHKNNEPKNNIEKQDYRKLTDLIKKIYYPNEPNWKIIGKQIQSYKKDGMTYMGMYYTLVYFFVIQKHDIKKSNGVGIIPYTYKKAMAYYSNINNIYTKTAEIESKDKIDVEQTEDIIVIKQQKKDKKLIDFSY